MAAVNPESYLNIGLCGVMVAYYAGVRFDRLKDHEFPPPSRSTTTGARYFFYLALYILFSVTLLALLTHFQQFLFPLFSVTVQENLKDLPRLYIAALLLTVLLETVPGLSRFDQQIREKMYEWAWIPEEARVLKRQLMRARAEAGESAKEAIASVLAPLRLGRGGEMGTAEHRVAQIGVVLGNLEQLDPSDFRWAPGLADDSGPLKELRERFGRLTEDWKALASAPESEAATRQLSKLVAASADALYADVCRLVARTALLANRPVRKEQFLRGAGYALDEEELPPLPDGTANLVCKIVFLVFAALLVTFVLLASSSMSVSLPLSRILSKTSMISIMYGGAVGAAVYVLGRANRAGVSAGQAGERWAAYGRAGAIALVIGACASYACRVTDSWRAEFLGVDVADPSWPRVFQAATEEFVRKIPWLLMPGVVAFVLTWRSDLLEPEGVPGRQRQRWADTLWIAGINTLAGACALALLEPDARPWAGRDQQAAVWPVAIVVLSTMFLVGIAVGVGVPEPVRRLNARRAKLQDTEDPGDPPLGHA